MKYIIVVFALAYSIASSAQEIYEYNETHSIENGHTLYLTSDDADITIEGTNRKDASVEIYRNAKGNMAKKEDFKVVIKEKDGDLYITEERKRNNVVFLGYLNISEYTIKILLPHNVQLELTGDDDNYNVKNIDGIIDLTYEDGNVNISDSKTPQINIKGDDGNLRISDFNGDFEASLEDGNLTMNDCRIDKFDVRIDDGNISLKSSETGDTKIKTEDGNVNLDVVKGNLSVTLDDGKLIAHEVYSESIDIRGYDGGIDLGIHMKNNGDYKVELDDGDLNVDLLSGGGTFKVKCDDGNVKMNSRDFDMLTDDDHFKEIKTIEKGNGKMIVRIEDGNVRLSR